MTPKNLKENLPADALISGESAPAEKPVSDLNRARSDLAQSEQRYRLLVENIADYAIFLLDPRGYIQSWNKGAERIKGYSAAEVIGKHFSIFYTPEDLARHHPEHELEVATRTGKFEEESWRLRKDGTQFWANVLITRLTDPQGKVIGFAKVTRDLTERKITEERLRLSEERFRLLISSVKDYAIFMLDPNGNVATWNEGAQRLKGYLPEEIIGKHFSTFYPEEDVRIKKPNWELEEAALTGRFEDEGWRIRKDGTRFWANVVLTAIRDTEGKLIGYAKVTRDITDRKRLEEKLRRSNEELDRRVQERTRELEKAIRARDEFMRIISHELRTPVTALQLQVQTALRQVAKRNSKTFEEWAVKFVTGAGRQLDRLARLIDDMLDGSRISMDRLPLQREPVDLNALTQRVVDGFQDQFAAAGSSIQFERARFPLQVSADVPRLEQALSNLLMNALKYGQGQPVTVRLGQVGNEAQISIEDHGIGIAHEDQHRIFGRFERAVSANSFSGMGLGLYLSQKIVEAHQGRMSVVSEPGKGSIFTISLRVLS